MSLLLILRPHETGAAPTDRRRRLIMGFDDMGLTVRQSTARTLMVGPVLDASGVAVTDGVVGDFKISKNGAAPAALNGSATLTHRHTGFYSLALTASDLDTVGQGEITIDDTVNACPIRALTVIEEAVYDALFVASATGMLPANVIQLGGVVQSLTDLKDFADDGYDPSTNKVQGVVLTDTVTTYTGNTPQTGDAFARLGAPAGASVSADIATRASQTSVNTIDGIVDDILVDTAEIGVAGAGLTNIDLPNQTMNITGNITGNLSGSVGSVTAGVTLAASAVQAIWDALTSALTTVGSIGKLLVDNINATISSRSSHSASDVWAVATRLLTAGTNIVLAKGIGVTGFNDLSAAQVNTEADTALADVGVTTTVTGRIDVATSTRASQTSVDDLPTNAELATVIDAIPTAAENAAGLLDLADGIETGLTLRQAQRLIAAALAGELSGAATTTIVIRNAVADSKDRITATVDASGNRSAITVDLT